jgi:hypothetical protein
MQLCSKVQGAPAPWPTPELPAALPALHTLSHCHPRDTPAAAPIAEHLGALELLLLCTPMHSMHRAVRQLLCLPLATAVRPGGLHEQQQCRRQPPMGRGAPGCGPTAVCAGGLHRLLPCRRCHHTCSQPAWPMQALHIQGNRQQQQP